MYVGYTNAGNGQCIGTNPVERIANTATGTSRCSIAGATPAYNTLASITDAAECDGTNYCNNQYQYYTGKTCSAGTCSTGNRLTNIANGQVCQGGASVAITSASTCGTGAQSCYCANNWYQCDAINDCTYDQYYVGFTTAGACTAAGVLDKRQTM